MPTVTNSLSVVLAAGLLAVTAVHWTRAADSLTPKPQYEHGEIRVVGASVDEPIATNVSAAAAAKYLDQGNAAWNGARGCVSCHTNGIYMTVRPALTKSLGQPEESARQHFVTTLDALEKAPREDLLKSTKPAQVIYTAAGLAEWDAHVTGKLSPETDRALRLMLSIQLETGTFGTLDCWPPYESDAYHEATVAAMAVAAAPGWAATLTDDALKQKLDRLHGYLRNETPPHDYGRTLLLWTACRIPELLSAEKKAELVEVVRKKQQADGGWSLRTFASPEQWGKGNRAKKLRGEPDFESPASDGHQTGLAVVVLREAGVPANDPQIQKAIGWLTANQRVSGRWWTRSLNTDGPHYITYSGTAFSLLALQMCDALPKTAASAASAIGD
jgi:squalene-hopene/tetraprenyl-beta-curcumene cyclase